MTWELLDAQEKRRAVIVLLLILLMAAVQMAGVASIMPFMTVAGNPGVVNTNRYLHNLYVEFGNDNPARFLFLLGLGVMMLLIFSLIVKGLTYYAQIRFSEMRN